MSRLTTAILLLAPTLSLGVSAAQPPTPAEQFKALRDEYDKASSPGRPLTDEERRAFIGKVYKHRSALAGKLAELAEKHPNDPVALDALLLAVWQVNGTPWPVELVGDDPARAKALGLIVRDHLLSDKLGPLCERVAYGFCEEYEALLRAVLAKNPHEGVKAAACLALARFLNNRQERLDLCREQPELAKDFADLFGKEYLAALQRQPPGKVLREVEDLLELAAGKYAAAKLPGGGTAGERAQAELFALRHLQVGKEAPDIEGEDQYGKRFKLSDYRSKVVLLDFWSYV
jgi:hypothetical protein